ncbi:MAG: VRR-NUC domain-containing protein [Sulfurovum sp.]|nr:VRR-NUC domain-containing protein [Sulfurovaceae bacterium]
MNSESIEQQKLHQWCKNKRLLSFSVPNGGTRNKAEAVNLRKEGVVAGVSDYIIMLPKVILFIELKRQKKLLKNGTYSISHTKLSQEQMKFLESVDKFDYAVSTVAYGFDEAKTFIEKYL